MFFRLSTLVTLFSLAAVVVAIPPSARRLHGIQRRDTGRTCGSELSPELVSQMEDNFASDLKQKGPATSEDFSFEVPVVFHVIYPSGDNPDGDIPDDQIDKQIDVLNQDYSDTGLTFNLVKTNRVLNDDWFNNVAPGNDQETAMKELREGGPATLNVYTVGFDNDDARGLLGYATFPEWYAGNPQDDGVVLHYGTLPDGSKAPFNLGATLTHEAGHWVGLYHTFQNGCSAPGDSVDDTPAEAKPTFGCPQDDPDTCPAPGIDPIHNYMDYTDDSCMNNFTPGQAQRLQDQLKTYRGVDS